MKRAVCVLMLLALVLSSCSGPYRAKGVTSLLPAEKAPALTAEPVSGSAVGDLGLELLRRVPEEKPVISPLSVYLALGMAATGAGGKTLDELEDVLGGSEEEVNAFALSYMGRLRELTVGKDVFESANSLWIDEAAEPLDDFIARLCDYYSAEGFSAKLDSVDAMNAVNGWIDLRTHGLIPRLITEPMKEAQIVEVNTLYMMALWEKPFNKAETSDGVFFGEKQNSRVPFMTQTDKLRYLTGDGYTGVVLPYRTGGISFIALKPDGLTPRKLLDRLTGADIEALAKTHTERKVELRMPRLSLRYRRELRDLLRDMGLAAAFSQGADFSRMGTGEGGQPLMLSSVLTEVSFVAEEEYTEAAAVTANTFTNGAPAPAEAVRLDLDEPFLYIVADAEYGVPLFLGICDLP